MNLCEFGHDVVVMALYSKVDGRKNASAEICVRCKRVFKREPMGLMIHNDDINAWISLVRFTRRKKKGVKPV